VPCSPQVKAKSCPASNGWPAAGVPGHSLLNLEQLNWGYFLWRPTRFATLFAADGNVKSSWSASAAVMQPVQAQHMHHSGMDCSLHKCVVLQAMAGLQQACLAIRCITLTTCCFTHAASPEYVPHTISTHHCGPCNASRLAASASSAGSLLDLLNLACLCCCSPAAVLLLLLCHIQSAHTTV
jgi:hypothetical protein